MVDPPVEPPVLPSSVEASPPSSEEVPVPSPVVESVSVEGFETSPVPPLELGVVLASVDVVEEPFDLLEELLDEFELELDLLALVPWPRWNSQTLLAW